AVSAPVPSMKSPPSPRSTPTPFLAISSLRSASATATTLGAPHPSRGAPLWAMPLPRSPMLASLKRPTPTAPTMAPLPCGSLTSALPATDRSCFFCVATGAPVLPAGTMRQYASVEWRATPLWLYWLTCIVRRMFTAAIIVLWPPVAATTSLQRSTSYDRHVSYRRCRARLCRCPSHRVPRRPQGLLAHPQHQHPHQTQEGHAPCRPLCSRYAQRHGPAPRSCGARGQDRRPPACLW